MATFPRAEKTTHVATLQHLPTPYFSFFVGIQRVMAATRAKLAELINNYIQLLREDGRRIPARPEVYCSAIMTCKRGGERRANTAGRPRGE